MASPEEKNAMAKRLDQLETSIHTFFEESRKPLLRCLSEPGDEEIIDVFVVYEQEAGELSELIIETKTPFNDDADEYSRGIIEDVIRQYEEMKPSLKEVGFEMNWMAPEADKKETTSAFLVRVLDSFFSCHSSMISGLGLLLRPDVIDDKESFSLWIENLLAQPISPAVRLVFIDPLASPFLEEISEEKAALICSEPLNLDYPGMLEELAQGDGSHQGPDTDFRVLLVKITNCAEKQDIKGAEEAAHQALAIAETQNWLQMQVTVYMMMGACYLQASDHATSLESYQEALGIARKAKEVNDPAGPKMEITCLLSVASVHFALSDYTSAEKCYLEAAPLAEELKDFVLVMESWRMAAYCREKLKDFRTSYNHSIAALEAGEKMPEEQRAQSTLAYVGDGLIRLVKKARKKRKTRDLPDVQEVDEQMRELLGEKWRDLVLAGQEGDGAS